MDVAMLRGKTGDPPVVHVHLDGRGQAERDDDAVNERFAAFEKRVRQLEKRVDELVGRQRSVEENNVRHLNAMTAHEQDIYEQLVRLGIEPRASGRRRPPVELVETA
jgi:hypothetical protein